jgi:type IV pilus assembly protein PilO
MDLQSLPWYGQFLVFLLIGGILFGIFYMVYYSDNEDQIDALTKQIDALDKEIRKAEQKEMQLKQIKEEKEARERVLDKLKEILPEKKEISQILRKVQSIISGARLKIMQWTTQAERRQEIYVEVPISIVVDGSYHNLGIFFDQLAKLKKIFTVNNLSIKPLSTMNSTFTVKATFTASTYTYREKTAQNQNRGRRRR